MLSLGGPTRRSRLAGLFWPDSGEAKARTNLRQALSRLRKVANVVEGTDPLTLSPRVPSDLREAAQGLRHGKDPGSPLPPLLLPSFDYSDCPEFFDWLREASRELTELQRIAWERDAERAEASGDLDAALEVSQRLVALDPFSERAHRRLIRTHYVRGDRSAALHAYRQCEDLLACELGTSPMPKTQELLHSIERSAPVFPGSDQPVTELPVTVLRTPRLVGRDATWRKMETSWNQGRLIYLSGAPGIGKSRLAEDFVRAKAGGFTMTLRSRPGDASVPFASQARAIRETIAAMPGLRLVPWVRQELSRMLPELREPDDGSLLPLREEDARLRFFQAQVEFIQNLGAGPLTLLVDDLQFTDEESAGLGHYMFSALAGAGDLRAVLTYRSRELSPHLLHSVQELTRAGLAEHIELGPLPEDDVRALLVDLAIEGLPEESDALQAVSGGNPAILIEAVKETLRAGRGSSCTLPREAWALLERRLDGLGEEAQDLAGIAAIVGDGLTPELAAAVLQVHPLRLTEAWKELESRQILQGSTLVHDLLREAILSRVPRALLASMHARVANHLETQGADPMRIAYQWKAAGEHERAAPYLLVERQGSEMSESSHGARTGGR